MASHRDSTIHSNSSVKHNVHFLSEPDKSSHEDDDFFHVDFNSKPTDIEEDYRLAALLPRGKLSVSCIEVVDMHFSNMNKGVESCGISVRLRLGPTESSVNGEVNPWKTSQVCIANCIENIAKFVGDLLSFDVLDVRQYVALNDLRLSIEVLQHTTFVDQNAGRSDKPCVIAAVTMSVVRFFRRPYFPFKEKVPLRSRRDNHSTKVCCRA